MVFCLGAALTVAISVRQELDPIKGHWDIEHVYVNGREVNHDDYMTFLSFEGNHGVIDGYSICGSHGDSEEKGAVRIEGDKVLLYKCTDNFDHEATAFATIVRLPNGRLSYETTDHQGVTRMEFVRTQNAVTLMDMFLWY